MCEISNRSNNSSPMPPLNSARYPGRYFSRSQDACLPPCESEGTNDAASYCRPRHTPIRAYSSLCNSSHCDPIKHRVTCAGSPRTAPPPASGTAASGPPAGKRVRKRRGREREGGREGGRGRERGRGEERDEGREGGGRASGTAASGPPAAMAAGSVRNVWGAVLCVGAVRGCERKRAVCTCGGMGGCVTAQCACVGGWMGVKTCGWMGAGGARVYLDAWLRGSRCFQRQYARRERGEREERERERARERESERERERERERYACVRGAPKTQGRCCVVCSLMCPHNAPSTPCIPPTPVPPYSFSALNTGEPLYIRGIREIVGGREEER
jgi:hypothetical protein